MRRSTLVFRTLLGLSTYFVAVAVVPALAGSIPIDALPLPNRVVSSEAVVVGKVVGFEDMTVIKDRAEYKIAILAVSDAIRAPKETKTIRLGMIVIPPMVAINPRPFQASVGQEGCYFLTKHDHADFYVAGPLSFLDKNSPSFDADLKLIQRCGKHLATPNESLLSKNAEDRFLTAAMLVARYSTRHGANAKTEPIDAVESKRIMEALASADWTPPANFTQLSPQMVLGRLPLTAKDGWSPPARTDAKAYAAYCQQWTRDHAESYRVQRFVAEKAK